jgi:anti-sigma factor (TIGR02949 family)
MADEETIKSCEEVDARLAPYIDREDAPAARRAVDAHLAACPPCRRHADDEAAVRDLVREHRDGLRSTAPDALRARCAHVSTSVITPRRSFARRWAPLSVAATLVLAIAGVFLLGVNNPVQALAATLALDHVKCFKTSERDRPDAASAEQEWQQDHGWPITVPKTSAEEQLTLLDVRHCYSSDGKAAHMLYTWRGAPLSLYVLPEDEGHAGAVTKMGRDAVIWCANRRTYAVVADGHPADLARIVEYMKEHAK